LLSDAQWSLIADLLPTRTRKQGRPFRDACQMVEGIIYRYRCGIPWRDVPEAFGPWQTIWTWHRRMSADGTWDEVLARFLTGGWVELHESAYRAA
jgi:transposase